jgi:hypothetical protein
MECRYDVDLDLDLANQHRLRHRPHRSAVGRRLRADARAVRAGSAGRGCAVRGAPAGQRSQRDSVARWREAYQEVGMNRYAAALLIALIVAGVLA